MDTKDSNNRDTSTERLFDTEIVKDKRLKDEEEQTAVGATRDEELSLQNIFIDKGQENTTAGEQVPEADSFAQEVGDDLVAGLDSTQVASEPVTKGAAPQKDELDSAHAKSASDSPDNVSQNFSTPIENIEAAEMPGKVVGSSQSEVQAADTFEGADSATHIDPVPSINTAPVAGPDISSTVAEDAASISGRLSSFDADDGAVVSYGIAAGAEAPAGFSMNSDGFYSFDPTDDAYNQLNVGDSQVITIPITVTDDQGATDSSLIQITVTGTNDAPIAGADIYSSVAEGTDGIEGQLTSTDVDDGATASYSVSDGAIVPAGFTLNLDGSYSFDPSNEAYDYLSVGDSQLITIPVTVTDDQGAIDTSQIQITITGTNDSPVAGASVFNTVEEGGHAISGQITSTDMDGGATASYAMAAGTSVPDGFVMTADGGYSFDPGHEAYDHLNVGDSQVITIPVTVTDDQGATDTSQIQITVTGTNDAPVAGANVASSVEEGASAISGQLTSTDLDDGATASFSVTEGSVAPDGFEISSDGSYSFDPSNEAYDHLSVGDSQVITIPVTVTDDQGATDTSQIQITVTGTNDAPVAGANVASSVEEGASAISGQLTSTDLDDGAAASFSVTEGSVAPDGFEISSDGSYSFDPSNEAYDHLSVGDSQVITIPVTVTDDQGATDTSQIQITVTGTNDAPVAGANVASSVEEGASAISGQLTSTDLDDGATASFAVTEGSVGPDGFEINTDGSYSFDPSNEAYDHLSAGDSQVITIPVTVTDDQGATDTSQIQITVTGTNDAPVAGANVASSVEEGASAISGQLTSTDLDDGATASFSVTEGSVGPDGFEINTDGSYSFDPSNEAYDHLSAGDSQVITIPVTVTDDQGATDTSQIQITVTGTNDAPVAGANVASSVEEGASAISGQLTSTDLDDGATASFAVTEGSVAPDGFEINTDGSYSFDPSNEAYDHLSAGDSQVITIPVTVTDDQGATDTSQIQITVTGTNDAPVAGANVASSVEEGASAISGQLTSTDLDDGATASFSVTEGSVAPDGFEINTDGSYSFDPSNEAYDHLSVGDSQVITIPVTVTDDQGATDTSQIQITVTGTNDAPVAGANVASSVEEGASDISGQLTSTDSDENATASFSVTEGSVAPDGFEINTDGSYSFDPSDEAYDHLGAGDSQVITIPITVTDDQGATDTSQIQITVTGTNDAPVAGANITSSVEEGASVISGQLASTDSDDAATASFSVTEGSVVPDGFQINTDGSYSFDPSNEAYDNLSVGDSQVITIPVTVTDDQGATDTSQIQITVSGTNDAPTAISATGGEVAENVGAGTVAVQLSATDVDDGDSLSYSLTGESDLFEIQGDQVVVKSGAQINYEADDEHTLNIQVTDENGASYEQEIVIQVSDINETPTDIALSCNDVNENSAAGTVVATLSTSDQDTDESFTYQLTDDSGMFEISGDQVVVSEGADIDYESQDAHDISVEVTDSAGNSYTENFTISVNDLVENIGPVAEDDTLVTQFTPENATLTVELNFDDGVPSAARGSLTGETDGQVGNAADFSGAKLSVGGLDLDGADGAKTTVSMWIQGNAEGGWEMLAASDVYDMVMLNGNIGFNTGQSDMFGTDASELNDGEWHHIVGTFTNGDLTQNTIFIDGVEQEMSQIQGSQATGHTNIDSDSGTMHFGSWGVNDSYRFSGSMDEIKVFNGELSGDEVGELYEIESGHDHWQNGGHDGAQEDTALVINPAELLANDTDADGDTLSIVSVEAAEHGSVEINEDGEIVFTPDENYHGEASFSYTVSDGNGGTDSATVSVNVSSVNDAPVIDIVESVTVAEGATTISGQVTSTDLDDDATASFAVSEDAETPEGFVLAEDGSYSFDPAAEAYDHLSVGESEVLIIPVTVTDDAGATDTSEIQITVTGTNDVPVASDETLGTSFTPENATLTAELNFDDGVPSAARGSLTGETDGQVGNAADFSGAKLSVGGLDLDGADGAKTTVSMWIQGNAEGGWEMLAASDVYDMVMLNGDIGFNTGRGDMFGTDASELADGEWHHIVGTFTNGDLTQNTIFIDGVEQEMSQIRGSQATGNTNIDSDSGTMHFGSWGVNDNYRFSGSMDEIKVFNGELSGDEVGELYEIESGHDHWQNGGHDGAQEDTALVINPAELLANDTDADGDTLSIVSVEAAEHGSVEINEDGEIVFTPDENYHGEASFSYTVSDGNGGTDTATVSLNVTSVNDAPVIDIIDNVTVAEDASTISGQLSATDSDEGSSASFTVSEGSAAPEGFALSEDGSYSFDPGDEAYDHLNVGDSQVLTIPVTVTDEEGAVDTSQIQITVTGTNDAPVASNQEISTEEGAGLVGGQLPGSDADDNAQLTYTANGDLPAGFSLSDDGSYEFDPADSAYDHYGADSEHTQSVSYTVTDEHGESSDGTLYIGIDGQNDAVSLIVDTAPGDNTVAEDAVNGSPVGIVAHASDVDGDAVSYSIVDSNGLEVTDGPFSVDSQSGVVTVNDASQLDYEDAASHDLIIEASSSDGTSSQQSFSVAVTDVDENVAPEADDDVGRVWVPETSNETVDNLQIGSFDGESVEVSDWGTLIDGSAVYEQGNVTVTTSISDGELTAYNKAGHVGFGIGNDDGNGLDRSETLTIDIEGGNVNRVDFTLSGLGGWFDESSSKATEVLISAYDQNGDLIETQGGYRDSGSYNDNYSFETKVAVDRFEITTEGSDGSFVVQNMTLSATDTIEVPGHWENVSEDSSITIDVLSNDGDVDGDSLIISGVESPVVVDGVEVGSAEIVDVDGVQQIQFTPDQSMNAMGEGDSQDVSFKYTVSDGEGGTDSAVVSLTIDGSNDAPVVKVVELEATSEGAETTFSSKELLANSSDVDGDNLVVTGVSVEEEFGAVTENEKGEWTFTPAEGYSGEDVPLTFSVSDGTVVTESKATIDVKESAVKSADLEGQEIVSEKVDSRDDGDLASRSDRVVAQEEKATEEKEQEQKAHEEKAHEEKANEEKPLEQETQEEKAQDEKGHEEKDYEESVTEEFAVEDEIMFAMESRAEDSGEMGWAEKVDVQDDFFGAANQSGWEDDSAAADDYDLAASALDLAPDTSGVVTMTEGSDIDSLSNLQDSANF